MKKHLQKRNADWLVGRFLQRDATPLEAARLAELNAKGDFERAMTVGAIDVEARTIELAFSSEFEGRRWFGLEVLDHSASAVRLERLNDGGSFLVNHNEDDQVGVIVSASVDADRRGRAIVRMGNSERANEIFRDIQDGIRKHVSVRYRVHAAVLQEVREGDVEVIRITDWEPMEISIVPVPFDPTVGVNRSAEKPHEETASAKPQNSDHSQTRNQPKPNFKGPDTMTVKILRNAAGDLVRAEVDEAGAITKELETLEKAGEGLRTAQAGGAAAERARSNTILEMGSKYKMDDLARKFVSEGKTVEEFQRAALEESNTRISRPLEEQARDANLGMSEAEVQRYSFLRAARAMLPTATAEDKKAAAFEIEASRSAAAQLGKEARGIIIPADVLSRAFNAGGAANTPAGAQSGNQLVQQQLLTGSFIEMLRNRTAIMRLATTMGGLVGNVDIPKQTGGATAYWLGEGQDAAEGSPAIGQISFSPKTLAAYTDITRRLMMQSTPDAEGIVRRDLVNALAQAIDFAGYYGSGADNQPKGMANYTGINAVNFAGVRPTFAEVVQMETEVAADNADIGQMGYIANTRFRGAMKTTPKFGTGTEATIWEQGGSVNGYRTEITNQVADKDVFFGNFADFIIAMWGGLDMTVDPYSLSKSGGIRIVVFQDVDMNLRRNESICYGKGA